MSSHRAALIAAIREAPDDDAPRMLCADWLEEQGDEASVARAEFIRTQVLRAKLPPEDPRHSELEARELRLLKRYAPVWCGSHFVFRKVLFRRGFIEYVHLHLRHFLHHRRQMLALEPVRDVRLTGWYPAPDDLVRRVAGCEEWKYVETLRIHHQGPHKEPRSNLVLLLESPHLSRLRALHCSWVAFNVDSRRRFERLPILRRLTDLRFPSLDWLPQSEGNWFSDGGTALLDRWGDLNSLKIHSFLSITLLRRFTEAAFWDRLTALELVLPAQTSEALSLLRDRMPEGLQELRLHYSHSPADYSMLDSFLERLARAPLRGLRLDGIPISASALRRLLDGTNRWELRDLSLPGCDITADHARALAGSPGVKDVLSLDLTGNLDFDGEAARALFSSGRLRSVVDLNLSSTPIGSEGAVSLAAAEGWDRLRSINLLGVGLETDGVRSLMASPNLGRLVWLSVGESGYRGEPSLVIPPDLAAEITRLPHLASLRLGVSHCDPRTRQILSGSDSLAWPSIFSEGDSVQAFRALVAPERQPPLDAAVGRVGRW